METPRQQAKPVLGACPLIKQAKPASSFLRTVPASHKLAAMALVSTFSSSFRQLLEDIASQLACGDSEQRSVSMNFILSASDILSRLTTAVERDHPRLVDLSQTWRSREDTLAILRDCIQSYDNFLFKLGNLQVQNQTLQGTFQERVSQLERSLSLNSRNSGMLENKMAELRGKIEELRSEKSALARRLEEYRREISSQRRQRDGHRNIAIFSFVAATILAPVTLGISTVIGYPIGAVEAVRAHDCKGEMESCERSLRWTQSSIDSLQQNLAHLLTKVEETTRERRSLEFERNQNIRRRREIVTIERKLYQCYSDLARGQANFKDLILALESNCRRTAVWLSLSDLIQRQRQQRTVVGRQIESIYEEILSFYCMPGSLRALHT